MGAGAGAAAVIAGHAIQSSGGIFGSIISNEYNKRQNEIMRKREDTAVTRRAADLKNAGINPMMAGLGQGAQAQFGQPMSMDLGTQGAGASGTSVGNTIANNKAQEEVRNASAISAKATAAQAVNKANETAYNLQIAKKLKVPTDVLKSEKFAIASIVSGMTGVTGDNLKQKGLDLINNTKKGMKNALQAKKKAKEEKYKKREQEKTEERRLKNASGGKGKGSRSYGRKFRSIFGD